MKKLLPFALLFVVGCGSKEDTPPPPDPTQPTTMNSEGGVAPIGSGAVAGATPVTSQSLGGGTGGGVAQAAKGRAMGVAATADAKAAEDHTGHDHD